ncbi:MULTISPECIES: hypothetical protein [Streptomyces]|uniref:hypothetical protein n=1 Tax=Streptomyces tendae TaxID=1932 RepID=UPI003830873F
MPESQGPHSPTGSPNNGHRPTVVEHARQLRSGGSPIVMKAPAIPVAERTGIPARPAAHTGTPLAKPRTGRPDPHQPPTGRARTDPLTGRARRAAAALSRTGATTSDEPDPA